MAEMPDLFVHIDQKPTAVKPDYIDQKKWLKCFINLNMYLFIYLDRSQWL